MAMIRYYITLLVLMLIATGTVSKSDKPGAQVSTESDVRTVYSRTFPKLDGSHLEVFVVELTPHPSEDTEPPYPHLHPCPVIGYVVQGTVRMKMRGEPEAIYKAGDSFYEAPNEVHEVLANASGKEFAKVVAFLVCDHKTALTIDVPGAQNSDEKRP